MVSYISEIKLQQKLRRVAAISIISLILLCAFTFATFQILSYVYRASDQDKLEATLTEYAVNIKRKAQGEQRALRTLASFTKSADDLISSYKNSDAANLPFEVIGFWNLDGSCKQISVTGVSTDGSYDALPPQMKLAVSSAWLGNVTLTSPYYSPTIGMDMITYVNPVYDGNGKIIGALSGAVTQESFDHTLDQLSLTYEGVDSFLCTSSGRIFSHGANTFLPKDLDNITEFQGFASTSRDAIKISLVSTTPHQIDVTLQDHKYRLNITPLGFSDWYLCTMSSNEVTSSPYFKSLILLVVSLCIILTVCGFIAVYLFVSMKSSYKTQLLIAHYDPVTHSYNYPKFLLEFDHLDYRSAAHNTYAVASLNIHDFSYIVDMLGEQQTDDLLCSIADVIRAQPSVIMFCHHEVDQFFLIINASRQEDVDAILRQIMESCVQKITANITAFPVVMYAGVAFTYPDLSPERMVARAEFAKKQIIKSYTHAVRFYDENAYKKEAFLHNIEQSMRLALEQEEFKLFLQPKIDIRTGKIYAAEALVRWISDSDVIVYPNDFIPLFEQNGFCTELDLYMFDKVCAHIRYYLDQGIEPIYFSINQTKLLIFQAGYTSKLRQILQKYAIPPRYIVIEVLEDLATHNVEDLNFHIKELKQLGLSIALDDFGSGYSSLNIVAGLDIDEIKFDREFLMADDPEQIKRNHMILRVLSKLSKELGIRTVVEGVERQEDVDFLRSIDCDIAQGYYYDRPIPVAAFDQKYMTDRPLTPAAAQEALELKQKLQGAAINATKQVLDANNYPEGQRGAAVTDTSAVAGDSPAAEQEAKQALASAERTLAEKEAQEQLAPEYQKRP